MSINRRIVVTAVQTMELREDPIPAPAPGEVRVRSTLIGVCGSDTHAFHGRHPFIPIPYMPGHEATGVVEELGEGVTSVAVGDRIVVEPTLPCWKCKPCRQWRREPVREPAVLRVWLPRGRYGRPVRRPCRSAAHDP